MNGNTSREAARALLETRSVLFNAREPFTYTSGKQGPVYVDCRRLISFPRARTHLMDMAATMIRDNCPGTEYIAGGETAGIPYAAMIAERLEAPMLYVRKQPKGFGRMSQIEGHIHTSDAKVVLVEDLQTDGGSKKVFIDALRKADMVVEHCFVIFHYNIFEASQRNMEEMGVTLHSLTDWWAVLEAARADKNFDEETLQSVEAYLKSPETWTP